MSNMSYCRFQNTLRDLSDCQEALERLFGEGVRLSQVELKAAKELVATCIDFTQVVGDHMGLNLFEDDDGSDFRRSFESAIDEANAEDLG